MTSLAAIGPRCLHSARLACCWIAWAALATSAVVGAEAADDQALVRELLDSREARSGLCVHVGFRDADLAIDLARGGGYVVHALTTDADAVEQGRKQIRAAGLGGAVSLERDSLERLPYADNLVNLLVAEAGRDSLGGDEIVRVLCPGGIAFVAMTGAEARQQFTAELKAAKVTEVQNKPIGAREWIVFRKPRPEAMDEWTHRRYDATRNAVSRDQVEVPTGLRWLAGPNWPTGHRKQAVRNKVVSAQQLVYLFDDVVDTDDGPRRQKTLIARDAFNGLLLWKRNASNKDSAELIHAGDRIVTVLEDGGPLVALEASTGEVVLTYDQSAQARQVLHVDGRMLIQLRSGLHCCSAATGELQWEHEGSVAEVVAGDGHVYVQGSFRSEEGERLSGISAFDLASGRQVWQGDSKQWPSRTRDADLLLYQDGILVFSGGGNHAISAKDGAHLWSYEYPTIGHGGSDSKVVCLDGLVWVHNAKSEDSAGKESYAWEGLDPRTGRVEKRVPHGTFKHRCMADVATGRIILCGSMDFVDVDSEVHSTFTATRASCGSGGLLPANGLVYTFPHGCGCYPMLRGFLGLAADNVADGQPAAQAERGPAWPATLSEPHESADAWPTYRANSARSGSTTHSISTPWKVLWSSQLRDVEAAASKPEWDLNDRPRVTSAVVAEGLAYAAVSDTHELFALDAVTGETRWIFTAGGRLDCPPTIYRGLCLLTSHDGYVYCLRANDGELVWRVRAAPQARRIVAYGQLESAWPVVGGVLIHDHLAYFAAGRHGAADGGVHVYAADPATGEILWHSNPDGFTTVPDVLVAHEDFVQMADWQFHAKSGADSKSKSDLPLRSPKLGLLNNAWYRQPLALRKGIQSWFAHDRPAQALVFNDATLCGFTGMDTVNNSTGEISGDSQLFGTPLEGKRRGWATEFPLGTQVKALALAGDTLLLAGRLNGVDESSHALRAVSTGNGKSLAELPLTQAVAHGGLSIAKGRIYVTTEAGAIICVGKK